MEKGEEAETEQTDEVKVTETEVIITNNDINEKDKEVVRRLVELMKEDCDTCVCSFRRADKWKVV